MSDEYLIKTFYDMFIDYEVRELKKRTLYGKIRQVPWLFAMALGSLLWTPILLLYTVFEWLAKHQPAVYKDQ